LSSNYPNPLNVNVKCRVCPMALVVASCTGKIIKKWPGF